jgi:hypothetical protein
MFMNNEKSDMFKKAVVVSVETPAQYLPIGSDESTDTQSW